MSTEAIITLVALTVYIELKGTDELKMIWQFMLILLAIDLVR